MRTGLLLTLMLGSSLAFADHPSSLERPVVSTSPFAAIARVVTSREAGKTVSARFDAATCAVHIRFYISGGVTELDVTTAPAYEPMEHCITSGRYRDVSDNP